MSSPIADGVMAATHKLVQQAMSGQWNEVPKTVHERRALLDQLNASASPQDFQWLTALRQAMAESDAVVASMNPEMKVEPLAAMQQPAAASSSNLVDDVMDMIKRRHRYSRSLRGARVRRRVARRVASAARFHRSGRAR
jgi:hypothetical protein